MDTPLLCVRLAAGTRVANAHSWCEFRVDIGAPRRSSGRPRRNGRHWRDHGVGGALEGCLDAADGDDIGRLEQPEVVLPVVSGTLAAKHHISLDRRVEHLRRRSKFALLRGVQAQLRSGTGGCIGLSAVAMWQQSPR